LATIFDPTFIAAHRAGPRAQCVVLDVAAGGITEHGPRPDAAAAVGNAGIISDHVAVPVAGTDLAGRVVVRHIAIIAQDLAVPGPALIDDPPGIAGDIAGPYARGRGDRPTIGAVAADGAAKP